MNSVNEVSYRKKFLIACYKLANASVKKTESNDKLARLNSV